MLNALLSFYNENIKINLSLLYYFIGHTQFTIVSLHTDTK